MNIKTKKIIDFYLGSFLIFSLRPCVYLLGKILNKNHVTAVRGDIAFIKLLGGGSLVIAFPSILAIKKRYPQSKLILVTTPAVQPFAQQLNVFDHIQVIDDKNNFLMIVTALLAWQKCLWIDTVIDFEVYSKLSTVFSLLTMSRNRIGFYMEDIFWRKHINTHLIYFNRFSGSYLFYEQVAHLIGATPETFESCRTHLVENAELKERKDQTKQISIGFACSDFGQERMLSVSQWHTFFMRKVKPEQSDRFLFLGSSSDEKLAQEIIDVLKVHYPNCEFENCAGKFNLHEAVDAIWASEEFWGIDSGLLHFARIAGIKSVSFWGPTDPQTRLKPIEYLNEEILYDKIPCSPCIHVADTPPCLGQNKCIEKLFNPDVKVDSQHLLFTSWPSQGKDSNSPLSNEIPK